MSELGRAVALDQVAVEVADHHRVGVELVVGDPGGLDHEQVVAGDAGGDVAGGPHDEPVAGQLGVQLGDLCAQVVDRLVDGPGHDAASSTGRARGSRRIALSRCITSLAPRPK